VKVRLGIVAPLRVFVHVEGRRRVLKRKGCGRDGVCQGRHGACAGRHRRERGQGMVVGNSFLRGLAKDGRPPGSAGVAAECSTFAGIHQETPDRVKSWGNWITAPVRRPQRAADSRKNVGTVVKTILTCSLYFDTYQYIAMYRYEHGGVASSALPRIEIRTGVQAQRLQGNGCLRSSFGR